jgi:hypothetical protein
MSVFVDYLGAEKVFRPMKKSQKQLLSFLFHIVVLVCMVVTYDAGKGLAQKLGWIESGEENPESTEIDLMAEEEQMSTEIDPVLAKLVKSKGDSYVFRRDLAFPPHLKVVSTRVTKYKKVRSAGKSEFGEGSMELSVREDEMMEYEMAGGSVRFTMKENVSEKVPTAAERAAKLKAIKEALEKKQSPPEIRERIMDPLIGQMVQFTYDGKSWKAVPTKLFKTMAWGRGLEGEIGGLLVENSLLPRPRWFGTNPMKVGELTKLAGKSMDLVLDGKGDGSLELVLKGMEGVHGHPCAVFEVSGSYIEKPSENERGETVGGEVAVDKGRIWCSLLFPLVLRSDLDLIVSYETREGSKVVHQLQGAVNEKTHRDWKAVTKAPDKPAPAKAAEKK